MLAVYELGEGDTVRVQHELCKLKRAREWVCGMYAGARRLRKEGVGVLHICVPLCKYRKAQEGGC